MIFVITYVYCDIEGALKAWQDGRKPRCPHLWNGLLLKFRFVENIAEILET